MGRGVSAKTSVGFPVLVPGFWDGPVTVSPWFLSWWHVQMDLSENRVLGIHKSTSNIMHRIGAFRI